MLVDKQNELMRDLLFTVHQHGGDDVTWKPPIKKATLQPAIFALVFLMKSKPSISTDFEDLSSHVAEISMTENVKFSLSNKSVSLFPLNWGLRIFKWRRENLCLRWEASLLNTCCLILLLSEGRSSTISVLGKRLKIFSCLFWRHEDGITRHM